MCVSLDAKALETVYENWLYTYPNEYDSNIPEQLQPPPVPSALKKIK